MFVADVVKQKKTERLADDFGVPTADLALATRLRWYEVIVQVQAIALIRRLLELTQYQVQPVANRRQTNAVQKRNMTFVSNGPCLQHNPPVISVIRSCFLIYAVGCRAGCLLPSGSPSTSAQYLMLAV